MNSSLSRPVSTSLSHQKLCCHACCIPTTRQFLYFADAHARSNTTLLLVAMPQCFPLPLNESVNGNCTRLLLAPVSLHALPSLCLPVPPACTSSTYTIVDCSSRPRDDSKLAPWMVPWVVASPAMDVRVWPGNEVVAVEGCGGGGGGRSL